METPGRRTALVAGAVLLAGALVGAVLVLASGGPDPHADRAAVRAYVAAVEPLARQGGRVVQLGLKPALNDLRGGGRPDPETERMVGGQRAEMSGIREQWARLSPPPRLLDAHRAFLDALDRYLTVADAIREASRATGPARETLLQRAIDAGSAADRVYDDASRAVQAALAAVGEPAAGWLPVSTPIPS